MKHPLFFSFCFLLTSGAWASGDPFPIGARAYSLGHAVVTTRDQWALFNNIGALSGQKTNVMMASFSKLYSEAGFGVIALGAVFTSNRGPVGIAIQRFGDEWYSEHWVGVGYSRQINHVSLGLKANYWQVAMAGLGSKGAVILEIGGLVELSPQLTFGAYVYNPYRPKLADYAHEKLPTLMKAGLSYKPSGAVWLSTEVEKDVDFPVLGKVGVEYEVVTNIFLRTGIQHPVSTYHAGIGVHTKRLIFDYALTTHPQLGLSHHVALTYALKTLVPISTATP